jgi:NTE family protein
VLAGGGVTGIAWELGVVAGLAESGVDVRVADVVYGTSAGSAVAAQITSGASLDDLVARQRDPETSEIAAELDLDALMAIFGVLADRSLSPEDRRAQVGAMAVAAPTVDEAVRRTAIEARLPKPAWPAVDDHRVVVTAVDAASGAFTTFDAASGVALVDAVAASCAVPGVWPPVTIGDCRYIDGGVRSTSNVHLAAGFDDVLVLTPMDPSLVPGHADELAAIEAGGSRVAVIQADPEALAAMGDNPLDPSMRGPAVEAGLRQGRAAADALRLTWTD